MLQRRYPEPEYIKSFKELDDMLTKHSQHLKPEAYEILAKKVFLKVIHKIENNKRIISPRKLFFDTSSQFLIFND